MNNQVHTKIRLDQLLKTPTVIEQNGFYDLFGNFEFIGDGIQSIGNLRLIEFKWGLYFMFGKFKNGSWQETGSI